MTMNLAAGKDRLSDLCFIALGIISVCGFLLFLLTGLFTKINIGNILGMALCAVLAFLCFFHKGAGAFIVSLGKTAAGKAVLTLCAVAAVLCIAAAAVLSALMVKAAGSSPEKPLTVIVLGCRVKENGPSLMLDKRISAAYDYLSENESVICIASGGKGDDEPISEAECIKNGLVSRGISPDRIILEDKSVNTRENIANSLAILESLGAPAQAVVVTSEFHQLRAKIIGRKAGLECYAVSSRTALPLLPSYVIREWLGLLYEIFLRR